MANKKFLFLLFFVFIVSGFGVYIWKYFHPPVDEMALSQQKIEADAALLREDYARLGKFATQSSRPAKDAYLSTIEESLKKTDISDWTREQLLLRKAIALSIMVGKPEEQEVKNAMEIFHNFVYFPGKSQSSTYLKDFAIAAGTKLQFQIRQFPHITLLNENSDAFLGYINAGYSRSLATYLSLNDLAKEISYENSFDSVAITNQITLESLILTSSEEKFLSSPQRKAILEELKTHLALFEQGKLKPLFFKDTVSAQIEPGYHYAVGYDIYQRNMSSSLSPEINQKIDQGYETILAKAKASPEFKKNTILDQVLFYAQVSYLASLHQRYGDGLDSEKLNSLVQGLLGSIQSSPETSSLAASYFATRDTYREIESLYALSVRNSALSSYLTSLR